MLHPCRMAARCVSVDPGKDVRGLSSGLVLASIWRRHPPAIPPGILGGMMQFPILACRRVRPPSRSSRRGSSAVRLGLGASCIDAQGKRQGKADVRQRKQEDVQQSKARVRKEKQKKNSLIRYVYEVQGYGVRGTETQRGRCYPTVSPALPAIKFFKRITFGLDG